jgi:outer membrane protein assembly factor BamE
MVSQLKPGMTKDQVRNTLGTPLLTDIFHADRWDYVYRLEAADGKREQRRLTVFFVDDKLARVAGDVVPAAPKPEAAAPKEEATASSKERAK